MSNWLMFGQILRACQNLKPISGQTKTPTLKNGDFVVADFDVEEFKTALRESPQEASKLGIVL